MFRPSMSLRKRLLLTASFVMSGLLAGQVLAASAFLLPEPVTIRKTAVTVAADTRDFLVQRDGSAARVWVFFTDKGVFDRAQFDAAAAAVSLDKSAKRRTKTGMNHVVFADLPVTRTYLDQIVAAGGKLRRTSAWLNAASFELPVDQLNAVAALPFVLEVRPMSVYKEELPQAEDLREDLERSSQNADALNYGGSLTQLTQINVPAVHTRGYDGSGVILAIFDTGFRKTHQAFANHYAAGRVLAEHDFIFNDGNTSNEAGDASNQWDHGTYIWSTSGGYRDGKMYGPAYKASFILCKTEDVRSETIVEEDNWIAALEWVSGLGADVITSSLGYSDWYDYSDMNGITAPISIAAGTADSLGIIVCNSMGNAGPSAGTLSAPADAFNILSIGAVNSSGTIAGFSSRGPTYDGRLKPDVCAMGVSTYCASSGGDSAYTAVGGTSLSTPLVAGVACLMVQAHPDWPPSLIRDAIRLTASLASTPDNTYGYGIVNANSAVGYGVSMNADVRVGNGPLTVQFTGASFLSPTSWAWDFGDGGTSGLQSPVHQYQTGGSYNVSLTVETALYGPLTDSRPGYILVTGDTLLIETDSVYAGQEVAISFNLTNSQTLDQIIIPFEIAKVPFTTTVDSIVRGTRTASNWSLSILGFGDHRYCYSLESSTSPLPPGSGEVLRLYLKTDKFALGSLAVPVDTAIVSAIVPTLHAAAAITYYPTSFAGAARTRYVRRGNADNSPDFNIDIGDLTTLIINLFMFGPPPVTIQSGDAEPNLNLDIGDLTWLVGYLFMEGPPPVQP